MRWRDSMLFIVLIGLLASCNRSQKNDAAIPATAVSISVVAGPQEPTSIVQGPDSPIVLVPTSTPTPLPSPTPTPFQLPSPQFGTPGATSVPAAPLLICVPNTEFIDCYDELLDMTFSYPSFMGSISYTQLRQGGISGYSYKYFFANAELLADAGGLSKNFSEARGGWFTDDYGFGGITAQEVCAARSVGICREVGSSVVVSVLFPEAQYFCRDAMIVLYTPLVTVSTDLPQHPLIHGFGFVASIGSPEREAELEQYRHTGQLCSPEAQETFDAEMEQLRLDLEAGTADSEIQGRFDAMMHLAESVESQYVGDAPVEQPEAP